MLSKDRRVSRSEFKLLNRPLKTLSGKLFSAKVYKTDQKISKFAFSISKKIEKKAVLRNKMRRMAYNTVQDSQNILKSAFLFHFFLNKKPKNIKDDITNDINNILHDFLS